MTVSVETHRALLVVLTMQKLEVALFAHFLICTRD